MKPLARRIVVWAVCAALLAAQWPASAWAAAGEAEPTPAEVMKMFRDLGVYKDDADPLKSYLMSGGQLTPIGRVMYRSLKSRYNPAEEVEGMKPSLDRLRSMGEYTQPRREGAARAASILTEKFGALAENTLSPAGSIEESFRVGAMREALLTGAAIADAPQGSAFVQVAIEGGFEFWDAAGLAFRMTTNKVTTYNRELQKNQRLMNQNRPPQAAPIPETGRYNYEMLQYSYWRLKNQETEYINATRIDRMIAIAELLGKQYPTDMWFNDASLEADLLRQAKDKVYTDRDGTKYSVFDIVDAKFVQRRVYLEGAHAAVQHFEADMNRFKASNTITDAQVATMSLNEANALRWLSLTVLETQVFHVKNQAERVDPTSPDAQAIMKIVDESDMTQDQKVHYKAQGIRMKERLDQLRQILATTRKALNNADYAGSLDSVQAALASTQKELGELSVDYSIYLEAPSTAFLAKSQQSSDYGGWNPFKHLYGGASTAIRGAYKRTPEIKVFGFCLMCGGAAYAEDMKAIDGRVERDPATGRDVRTQSLAQTFTGISALIASGRREDWVEARNRIMAMHPDAAQYALSGDATKVTDAIRISESLKANHTRITAVTEKNKTLDAAATFATWSISIALMAPMARATLNGVGKLSGVGFEMIRDGVKMGGVRGMATRAAGRSFVVIGEIAKHSAARLQSLEPDPVRIKSMGADMIKAGTKMGGIRGGVVRAVGVPINAATEYAAARYLMASGARTASVAVRQATFTGLSGGISAGFTVGTHLWDMGTSRLGGVNIGGWQAIEPGHSMFSGDWDGVGRAAAAGFKGGAWWANESFHPALGYIGLPSTVFANTKMAGFMETVGTRGVVGSAYKGMRVTAAGMREVVWTPKTVWSGLRNVGRNGSATVEVLDAAAASAGKVGFLEKLGEAKWYTGGPTAAFSLSMADNVAKYALFSQAAGYLGKKYSWYVDTSIPVSLPFIGAVTQPEENLERRIKRSNHTGQAWLESPAWLAIPTYGAHGARDAAPYMNQKEGMRQYEVRDARNPNGRMDKVANAEKDSPLPLDPVKPPFFARAFEARFFGKAPATEWIVTAQAKEQALRKEIARLSTEGGIANPLELMAVQKLTAGKDTYRTLNVTEEVQKAADSAAIDALVVQHKKSLEALSVEPGRTVKGWGEITPEIQIEIAKMLDIAQNSGRKLPPELSAKVREVISDLAEANVKNNAAHKVLRDAVVDLPVSAPNLDAAQRQAVERVLDWEVALTEVGRLKAKQEKGPLTAKEADTLALGQMTYAELAESLRAVAEAKLKAGELSPKEGHALISLHNAILSGDKRFNSFNRSEYVSRRAEVIFNALRIKYAERPEMLRALDGYASEVRTWAEGRRGRPAEIRGAADGNLSHLTARLQRELKTKSDAAPGKFGPSELVALEKALESVTTSAWVVRDAKGGAIPGWRAKQYVRLMQAYLGEGSHAKAVRSASEGFFEAMRAEYKGRDKLLSSIDGIEADVNAWVKSREAAKSGEEAPMYALIEKLEARLKDASGELSPKEGSALSGLVESISQLNREGLTNGILTSGRAGRDVQLFVKAPTSLGKTMLAYEGLLPYLEAEAAATKRKVMFLTFNTKLQAQAEFDFRAFNKLGSTVKFTTYEGLKTMIAEGKTKGRNIEEDYLMLQDEMDAAGQQPALTIGMVSGRVSRLNGQTVALNESNAGIAWGMSRLNTIRIEAAENQAQHIKAVAERISDAHVERARLGAIKTAADDVLLAVGQLKKAKGATEIELAEKAVEAGMGSLRRLVEGPMSEGAAESQSAILGSMGRMKEALAERPSANPEVRARLASEMESAFANQNRLMNLLETDAVGGFSRLPAEARRARMAIESKIENLEKDLTQAEASRDPAAGRRASILREQIEYARIEKTMVERFEGVDVSARLISLDDRISAIRAGEESSHALAVNPKLSRLMRQSLETDALLEPIGARDAGAFKSYREETGRVMRIERSIAETQGQMKSAERAGQPTAAFEVRLKELNASRETSNGQLAKLETTLGSSRLPELMRRSLTLEGRITEAGSADAGVMSAYRAETARSMGFEREIGEAQTALKAAKKANEPTELLEARLTELNAGRETSKGELRKLETQMGDVKSSPKIDALVRERDALEATMPAERRAAHQEYRTMLDRSHALSAEIGKADAAGRPALEAERATARGRLHTISRDLSASPARGDLGGMLRRIQLLSSETSPQALSEVAALRRAARTEIMNRFDEAGEQIVALTRDGKPGWDAQVNRLVERRRALQEAFAGDESAMYGVYRGMKESVRRIGEDPRLTEKPYEIAGDNGSSQPGAVLKRADFLVKRAREVEAKGLEVQFAKTRAEIEGLSAAKETKEYDAAVERLRKLEKELLRIDSEYWADRHLETISGDTVALFTSAKLLFQAVFGKVPELPASGIPPGGMGLTRYHAAKMLEALKKDPMMPAHQRDNLMWSYMHSLFLPKGFGRGSYVRSEIVNMVQGFHDSAAGVRVDNRTGKFNVVHNGQWFESMDNASRRWWELEYGTDLTLPYTHNAMSTIRDVVSNKRSYFISLSGTSGNKFEAFLRQNNVSVVGEGSAMPKNVLLEIVSTPEQRLARVVRSLDTLLATTKDQAVLRATDVIPAEARKAIEEYMAARRMRLDDPQVFKISEVQGEAAQAFLQGIRATQKNTGLIVLSVSDTRALRKVEAELKKAGVSQSEIAKVFADTEFLRANVPEANVLRQMNIEGLNTGKVKVLILDTRVGGRGLDLNFKGERNSTRADAFRGYTSFEMLVLGPEEMSAVHMVQAMGRIDTGRTLSKAPRQFSLLMDVQTARAETVFRNMFESDPFFVEMRKDPSFQAFARNRTSRMDWNTVNEYVLMRSADGTGEGQLLAQRHEKAVRENLGRRNLEVEENLLRQAQVLTDRPTTQSKNPALDRIR